MHAHQSNQTPSWNQMMSGWNALVNPPRCEVCGHVHAPGPAAPAADWLSQWNEMPMVKEWHRVWGGMLEPFVQSMKPAPGRPQPHQHQTHHAPHHQQGCCSCCQPEDCRCRCCVSDAHLLVYARFGESRVVPVTIENNIRREREVELELSDWTTHCKQEVRVAGQVMPETKFTLKPCESRTVFIAVRVTGEIAQLDNEQQQPAGAGAGAATHGAQQANVGPEPKAVLRPGRLADVDSCAVFYADLRVKGCDTMPVRIAIVILPRDCDAYKIDCRCGCCCC